MNRILLFAAGLFVILCRPAAAQKVGEIVVVIKKDATLMDSDKVVLRPGRGITLTVRQVKDRWFLVSRLGRRGWIHGDHIAKPNDAIKVFTAAIRRKPSSEIYNARGMIWQHKGEYDIAIKDYNEAIRINPESSSAYNNRGNCYLIKKKYDKAIADYGEALRISPKSAVTLNNRAIAWERTGRDDKALENYTAAIRADAKYSGAYINRAMVYRRHGKFSSAIRDFTTALSIDFNDPRALLNRGHAYRAVGQFEKAMADYRKLAKLQPKNALPIWYIGRSWSGLRKYDKAIASYNEALRIRPRASALYNSRGLAWWGAGDTKKALADFTEAIRLNGKDSLYYVNRGNLYAAMKDDDKAMADYTQATRVNPKDSEAWIKRAMTQLRRKQIDKAVAAADEAVRAAGFKSARLYGLRGDLQFLKGNYGKALSDFKQAAKLEPKSANWPGRIAWFLATCPSAKHRNGLEALKYGEKALELRGKPLATDYDTMAACFARLGDYSNAVSTQKKAIALVSSNSKQAYEARLKLYQMEKPYQTRPPATKTKR